MKKIICFDFDDVIVSDNIAKRILKLAGNKLLQLKLFTQYMKYSQDPKKFNEFSKKIVAMSKGMKYDYIKRIALKFKLTKGVRKTFDNLKKQGYIIVIVSTNDRGLIQAFLEKHNLSNYINHIYASKFGVKNGKMTGKIFGNIIKTEKISVVKEMEKKYKINRNKIVYVGDGLNDLPIIKKIGTGILFYPNYITKRKSRSDRILSRKLKNRKLFIVKKKDMNEILKILKIIQHTAGLSASRQAA